MSANDTTTDSNKPLLLICSLPREPDLAPEATDPQGGYCLEPDWVSTQTNGALLPLRPALVYSPMATRMPRAVLSRSWHVTPAAFRSAALACVVLFVVLGVAEIAARTPVVRAALHPPSLGSSSRRFELQLDGLERYVAAEGRVECIVLGNSTALMGVDPEALGSGYRQRTGHDLRCFNFGVSGMTASAAGAVAPILVERYRPWLLIYVVSARDIGQSVDGPLLASTPWVRYRQGSFSINGWLVEQSAAFRYYLLYRQWLDPSRWPAATSPSGTTPEGFFPLDARLPLSPALFVRTQRAYVDILNQPPSEPELAGLSRLLRLPSNGTQVVVVEAPAHETLRRWARRTSGFYAEAIADIRRAARQQHVTFWRVPARRIIPADGWADFVHLNTRGAARFSEWLGGRIAGAVREGRLTVPQGTLAQG
jgi:hypothetical protein